MDALPEELVQLICWALLPSVWIPEFKERRRRQQALLNLMRCSKLLHNLARPVLYHSFMVVSGKYDMYVHELLRLCNSKPDVTRYIRELDLDVLRSLSMNINSWPVEHDTYDARETWVTHTKSMCISETFRTNNTRRLKRDDYDSMIALLLVMCSKLETLVIEVMDCHDHIILCFLHECLSPALAHGEGSQTKIKPKPLQLLHTLQVKLWFPHRHPDRLDSYDVSHPADMNFFLLLPSLKTFSGYCGHSDFLRKLSLDAPSPLRSLELSHTTVSGPELAHLLTLCPHLRDLTLTATNDREASTYTPRYAEIAAVLQTHGHRLRHFSLRRYPDLTSPDFPPDSVLGDLSSLTHLSSLEVEWDAIYGSASSDRALDTHRFEPGYLVKTLPRTLREFSIMYVPRAPGDVERFEGQMKELMGSEHFPDLAKIKILGREGFAMGIPDGWRDGGKGVREESWWVFEEGWQRGELGFVRFERD